MYRRNRILWISIILISVLFIETVSAQILRRPIRRGPLIQQLDQFLGEPHRVGPSGEAIPGRLIQGDGRFLERALNVVHLFTETGAELKPVAVISFASFEEFKRVIQLVAEKIRLSKGSVDEPRILNSFLDLYERILGQGFDMSQPLGIILQTDGILFYPLMFTPLDLNSKIGRSMRDDYARQLPDGRYIVNQEVFRWPFGQLYIQQKNGWVFIAMEQQLNALPDDPTVLLQGLDKECLVAARFDLQNMPRMTTGAALALGEMNAVSKAETELDKAGIRLCLGYLRSLAEQADFLEYSLRYDERNNDYIVTQKEIVRPDTERQRLLLERKNAVSPFHGFYYPEGAILASHLVTNLTRSQREQLEIILDETLGKHLLTEEERNELKKRPAVEKQSKEKTGQTAQQESPVADRKESAQTDWTRVLTQALTQSSKPKTGEPKLAPPLSPLTSPSKESAEKTVESEIATDETSLADKKKSPVAPAEQNSQQDSQARDPRDRLAELLSKTPREYAEDSSPGETQDDVEEMPKFFVSEPQQKEMKDSDQLRTILREVAVCYYWGLIGSIRAGKLDNASTWSEEQGLIGAYNIAEGERFQRAFDRLFERLSEQYPDVYRKAVRKDYAEIDGFRLTRIAFRFEDFLAGADWVRFLPSNIRNRETNIFLAVREDAICFSSGEGNEPEQRLIRAISGMKKSLPVYEMFFVFSAYEFGRAFARSGSPNQMIPLKIIASETDPLARAYAVSEFTETSKTITLRISGLLTPSIWRVRENLREMRSLR